jgi:alpha-glucosidase (family GH31 glycosyl hydrolase)
LTDHFEHSQIPDGFQISTNYLILEVLSPTSPPSRSTLSISAQSGSFSWKLFDVDPGNLGGTSRSLESRNSLPILSRGLISRSGYSVIDDSKSPFCSDNGILLIPHKSEFDLYFFGYEEDYTSCIQDFLKLSGHTPLLPRYVLGTWWSRHYPYKSQDLIDIANSFRDLGIPLSVLCLDTYWHIIDPSNIKKTGYTFNTQLISQPNNLFKELHNQNIHISLNVHPSGGIGPHEIQYPEMARRHGIHPPAPVNFNPNDMEFLQNYINLLHRPHEATGVDFWWIDWHESSVSDVDPLYVLNHNHFFGLLNDAKRKLILSRYCGLGGQRYPIAFSGMTTAEWTTFQYQPYFTATSANVGLAYWSHSIGGYLDGNNDNELYVRWLQFGALLPILRIHSNGNKFQESFPWKLNSRDIAARACEAIQFHDPLLPFFYGLVYRCYRHSILPVRPMYHLFPKEEMAYHCPGQYALGDDVIAAPFTTQINLKTGVASIAVWIPPGRWFDFQTRREYGVGWHLITGGLERIPIFVRSGE